jgi:hypothetical protein
MLEKCFNRTSLLKRKNQTRQYLSLMITLSLPVFSQVEKAFHRSEESRHHFLCREPDLPDEHNYGELDAGTADVAVVDGRVVDSRCRRLSKSG